VFLVNVSDAAFNFRNQRRRRRQQVFSDAATAARTAKLTVDVVLLDFRHLFLKEMIVVPLLLLMVPALAKKGRVLRPSSLSSDHGSASRIVEGEASSPGWWPWMAALLYEATDNRTSKYSNQGCGGTLVHKDWVLTAAHCVIYEIPCPTRQLSVLIGATNLDTWFDETFVIGGVSFSPELRRVEAVVAHPD